MANLDLNSKDFNQGLNQAEKRGRGFASGIGGAARTAGKAALGLTTLVAGAGAAAFTAGKKLGNYADGLLDQAQQTGISVEALQEFRAVARDAGVGSDTLAGAAERLTSRLGDAESMSASTKDAFNTLGVKVHDADGSLRSMDDLMPEIIGALGDMENVTERNSNAADIFGRGYAELMPVVALGAEGFADARDRAHEMGDVMSEDSLNSANELRQGMEDVQASLGNIGREVLQEFIPVLNNVVSWVSDHMPQIREFITTAFERIQAVWEQALKPAFEAIRPLLEHVVLPILRALVTDGLDIVIGVIETLAALLTGDFAGAWRSLRGVVESVLSFFQGIAGNILGAIVEGIQNGLYRLREVGESIVTAITDAITGLPSAMLELGGNVVQGLVDGMRGALDSVGEAASGLWARLTGTFEEEAEIESPSRRFAMHGRNIVQGLADGVRDAAPMMDQTMTNLLDRMSALADRRDYLMSRGNAIFAANGFTANVNVALRRMWEQQIDDVNSELVRLSRVRDARTAPTAPAPTPGSSSFTPQQPYWKDRETASTFRRATNKFSDDVRRLTLANLRY